MPYKVQDFESDISDVLRSFERYQWHWHYKRCQSSIRRFPIQARAAAKFLTVLNFLLMEAHCM